MEHLETNILVLSLNGKAKDGIWIIQMMNLKRTERKHVYSFTGEIL